HARPAGWLATDPYHSPRSRADMRRLARAARAAVGRLGARLHPHLDEGLVMGRALMALVEMADQPLTAEDRAVAVAVEALRAWLRAGPWLASAWRERIGPLCAAVGRASSDEALQAELKLAPAELEERFIEAGLAFGVSPERILPLAQVTPAEQDLVAEAVAELSESQRTVLTLYFRESLGMPEIAELLGIEPERLQALYGRAGVAIRACLLRSQGPKLYGLVLRRGLRRGG
ncbi:MAG TPA: sigma factor-like helix-turn-helix DNA-binding protein, partial [Armatimonadota bacterium]|nr:sigma factor-like helix-turn-helix DNA-binding protein [Armatimonadota bacterium]